MSEATPVRGEITEVVFGYGCTILTIKVPDSGLPWGHWMVDIARVDAKPATQPAVDLGSAQPLPPAPATVDGRIATPPTITAALDIAGESFTERPATVTTPVVVPAVVATPVPAPPDAPGRIHADREPPASVGVTKGEDDGRRTTTTIDDGDGEGEIVARIGGGDEALTKFLRTSGRG